MSTSSNYDVIIAGGGPAGASAAIHLATCGARVLLAEDHASIAEQLRRLLEAEFGRRHDDGAVVRQREVVTAEGVALGGGHGLRLASTK